jgi:hypothetical protein
VHPSCRDSFDEHWLGRQKANDRAALVVDCS